MKKLTDIIVACLKDKGKLSGRQIAEVLGVPQKAVNVALGHLQRQGKIEKLDQFEEGEGTVHTPYGDYSPAYSGYRSHIFKIKEK